MSKISKVTKPAFPAPPINARKKPEAQGIGNEPQEEVLVNIAEPKAQVPKGAVRITDEPEDDEVKVYVPKNKKKDKKKSKPRLSRSAKKSSVPANFDVEEIPDEKDDRHLAVWVTVIVSLVVLCIGAVALYAFVNGYFDSVIELL